MSGSRPAIVAVLLVVGFAGCGPLLMWHGRDLAHQHRVRVESDDGRQYIVVADKKGPDWDGVALRSVGFFGDGARLHYAAVQKKQWFVVEVDAFNGRELARHGPFQAVGDIVASRQEGRLVFAAQQGGAWLVVSGTRRGPRFKHLKRGSIKMTPSGERLAYVGQRGKRSHAVVDGKIGPAYDGIADLRLADDGRQVGYLARRGNRAFAVINGVAQGAHARVESLELGKNDRTVYVVVDDGRMAVIDRGVASERYDRVPYLKVDDAGEQVVYAGVVGELTTVVVNGSRVTTQEHVGPFAIEAGNVMFAARSGSKSFVFLQGKIVARPAGVVTEVAVSKSGSSSGYIVKTDKGMVAVVDGKVVGAGQSAASLVLADSGTAYAFLFSSAGRTQIRFAGVSHPVDAAIAGTLVVSADGEHWGCMIVEGGEMLVFIDGLRRIPVATSELANMAMREPERWLTDPTVGGVLQDWVRSELALALRSK